MKSRTFILLLSCLLLILIGCQRGCTFARTIDREENEIKVNGTKVSLEAKLVDYRNSRAVNRNIFKRSVTHTYAVVFSARLLGYENDDFYAESVPDPDQVDLEKQLKRIQIKISKDKKHFALAVDKQTQDLVHLYKKKRVLMESKGATPLPNWSNLNINGFPSASSMIRDEIKSHCDRIFMNKDLFIEYVDDCGPDDNIHKILFTQWPNCNFSTDYYDLPRVRKLRKSAKWTETAENRILEILESDNFARLRSESYELMETLKSAKVKNALDSTYAVNWGKPGRQAMRSRILSRLNKPGAISDKWKKQIINQARASFRKFDRTGEEDRNLDAETSLAAILATGDTLISYNFLKKAMTASAKHYDSYDLIEAVYDNYNSFTPYQKNWVKQQTPVIMKHIKSYNRDTLFDAALEIVSCDQLKAWKKEYPDDLDFTELPEGCK